jgi:hypothetical protein
MQELAPERQALKKALDDLKVDAWVFEQDAGARPESIQKAFLDEVEAADLYVGLFWKGYGDYTIEEYEHAQKLGRDCLIYEKRAALNGQRDPRLQGFLDRVGNVEAGLTIKWFNEPAELTEAIKNDIQRLQARIFRERRAPRINVNISLAEQKQRDELLILLRKVKEFWIKGVLEKSVHGQALIELGKEAWTEKREHPWEQVLELPDQTSRTILPEEPIDKIFADVGRSLLILGAPGSGKTITLLTLARELIGHAEDNPAQPIPVMFNLSSWTDPKKNLLGWLIDELVVKYQVPKKIGTRWLEANWLLPLLDGLDEVTTANQSACVKAINAYVQNNGTPGLAVCSRLKEYTDLSVRLQVTGAICLQPVTPEQVKNYVARLGDALAGLSAALDKDPVLRTLAETPLMLDVMSLAYRESPVEDVANETLNTEKKRRSHLFDTYVRKMFALKGKGSQEFARKHTLSSLSWLARGMREYGQTVFLIEQLQPSWVATRGQRVIYTLTSRMVVGLIFALVFGLSRLLYEPQLIEPIRDGLILGLIFGLVPGLIDEKRFKAGPLWAKLEKASPRWQTLIIFSIYIACIGLISMLISGRRELVNGLLNGLVAGLYWGGRSRNRHLRSDIQSVETLRWSWVQARQGCVKGLRVGSIFGLFLLLLFILDEGSKSIVTLIGGLIGVPLLLGLVGAPIGGFFGGLTTETLPTKTVPNLGVKRSVRNAVFVGVALPVFALMIGLLIGGLIGLSVYDGQLSEPLARIAALPSVIILVVWPFATLWYGGQDAIQHYILRFILYWKGYAPLRYADFLDYATRLVFLQKVGGGYIFIHRLLLEHFAAMRSDEKQAATRVTPILPAITAT